MTAGLSRWLSEIRVPVYVVDEKRTLVYLNAAMQAWLSTDGEELVGQRCDYAPAGKSDSHAVIAAALAPPPTALAGEMTTATIVCPTSDGSSTRSVRYIPLGEDALECEGVIAIVAGEDLDESAAESTTADGADEKFTDLHRQLQEYRETLAGRYRLDRLIGKSAAMLRVQRQAALAIETKARTVVIGPPGSGREHVARTIHFAGDDTRAPTLMPLACPLLDAELLQSSITAFASHASQNPTTRPPTVLLCDADQLSEGGQAELAGFLALPGFELHMLATSRTSLLELAEGGAFRKSLAYALSTLEIHLPTLSERRQDIPLLAQLFVEEHNAQGGSQLGGFEPAALDLLAEQTWEGNVTQLREVVRAACEKAVGSLVTLDDLPPGLLIAASAPLPAAPQEGPIVLDELLADVEAELIRRAMRRAKGNKTKAAELLGISRPRLHRRWAEMEGE